MLVLLLYSSAGPAGVKLRLIYKMQRFGTSTRDPSLNLLVVPYAEAEPESEFEQNAAERSAASKTNEHNVATKGRELTFLVTTQLCRLSNISPYKATIVLMTCIQSIAV